MADATLSTGIELKADGRVCFQPGVPVTLINIFGPSYEVAIYWLPVLVPCNTY